MAELYIMYFTEIGLLQRFSRLIGGVRSANSGARLRGGKPAPAREPAPRESKAGGRAEAGEPADFSRGGIVMNENSHYPGAQLVTLHGVDCQKILQNVVAKRTPAIMSYLSRDKWHVAKVLLTALSEDKLNAEGVGWMKRPRPINIQAGQPVGISFKHGYGKFVFDTTVAALEPSPDPSSGGTIILAAPDRVGVVQRRSYFRVSVPESLKVNVVFWHRRSKLQAKDAMWSWPSIEPQQYFQGRLVDISAGGAQVKVPLQTDNGKSQADDFRKGQFIGLRFTPMPYETPLMFSAQIRNMLPAADQKGIFLGLQIVGLEASPEGRQVLSKLVDIVERYHQINQSGAKQAANGGDPLLADHSAGSQAPRLATVNS